MASQIFRNSRSGSSISLINRRFLCTSSPKSTSYSSSQSSWLELAKAESEGNGSSGSSNNGKQGSGFSRILKFCILPVGAYMAWESYRKTNKPRLSGNFEDYNRVIDRINDVSDDMNKQRVLIKEFRKAVSASMVAAMIRGPFNLVDHNGKSVTRKDFLGQWNLIYFGDTHSPELCTKELQKLALAIDEIQEKSGIEVVPIFLSVDPERDTVERVREFVQGFHPKLIGITGAELVIKKTERVTFLMDPNMKSVKFLNIKDNASLANDIMKEIAAARKIK